MAISPSSPIGRPSRIVPTATGSVPATSDGSAVSGAGASALSEAGGTELLNGVSAAAVVDFAGGLAGSIPAIAGAPTSPVPGRGVVRRCRPVSPCGMAPDAGAALLAAACGRAADNWRTPGREGFGPRTGRCAERAWPDLAELILVRIGAPPPDDWACVVTPAPGAAATGSGLV